MTLLGDLTGREDRISEIGLSKHVGRERHKRAVASRAESKDPRTCDIDLHGIESGRVTCIGFLALQEMHRALCLRRGRNKYVLLEPIKDKNRKKTTLNQNDWQWNL